MVVLRRAVPALLRVRPASGPEIDLSIDAAVSGPPTARGAGSSERQKAGSAGKILGSHR